MTDTPETDVRFASLARTTNAQVIAEQEGELYAFCARLETERDELRAKLAMCRDALDFIRRNVWDQGGIIAKAAQQALDQTK